jgi:hypothetical protein
MGRRPSASATCESCVSIDVRQWAREGRLQPGQVFSYGWEVGGRPAGTIRVRTLPGRVLLEYVVQRSSQAPPIRMEQQVRLVWTQCHYGGERPWFLCTGHSPDQYCRRRVAKLYGGEGLFTCRHCWGLAYRSQRQSPEVRALNKAKETRVRLGGTEDLDSPFPPKPKGMHWRTYERLRAGAKVRNQ